eukprot:1955226-Rhodomonas_salina.1
MSEANVWCGRSSGRGEGGGEVQRMVERELERRREEERARGQREKEARAPLSSYAPARQCA